MPVLWSQKLITARKPIIMHPADGAIIEVFERKLVKAIEDAHRNPVVAKLWERYSKCCTYRTFNDLAEAKKVFPGFEPIHLWLYVRAASRTNHLAHPLSAAGADQHCARAGHRRGVAGHRDGGLSRSWRAVVGRLVHERGDDSFGNGAGGRVAQLRPLDFRRLLRALQRHHFPFHRRHHICPPGPSHASSLSCADRR
jgi:hypothetical protein